MTPDLVGVPSAGGGQSGVEPAGPVTSDLVVGLGCRPGTSADAIRAVLNRLLDRHDLPAGAIRGYATVAARASEPGLRAIAGPQLLAFAAGVLAGVPVPNPSARVAAAVGTGSVAEAAAVHAATLLAGPEASVELIAPKLGAAGVTVAVARIVAKGM